MKILQGQKLKILGGRGKGIYTAEALRDFDTDEEWFPVKTLQRVEGIRTVWEAGESIPCRNSLNRILEIEGVSGDE